MGLRGRNKGSTEMPKKPTPKIDAWSYSRWDTYDKCPHQALHKFVLKTPVEEKESKALVRGRDVHELAENFVDAKRKPKTPPDLELFEEEFLELRSLKKKKNTDVFTERQWAFDSNWQAIEWYDRGAWCRIKTDVVVLDKFEEHARVIDHKTGKIRTGYEKQNTLYALGAFSLYDWLQTVNTELWFLDQGEIKEIEYVRSKHFDKLRREWERRVKALLTDRKFRPKPNGYVCSWCPYAKKRGGPCKHGDK